MHLRLFELAELKIIEIIDQKEYPETLLPLKLYVMK